MLKLLGLLLFAGIRYQDPHPTVHTRFNGEKKKKRKKSLHFRCIHEEMNFNYKKRPSSNYINNYNVKSIIYINCTWPAIFQSDPFFSIYFLRTV